MPILPRCGAAIALLGRADAGRQARPRASPCCGDMLKWDRRAPNCTARSPTRSRLPKSTSFLLLDR